ncbi:RIP metalloprotease RseP [Pseudodesulfovibrio sp.]|uniref:RIP metalloprotease RseP n=1 Tax=Pseudodesulfovibrio sp. TaxID=2035812 RepID=UPI00262F6A68|nr:RIP metalloprotease RseP [Pseudodesulfovibrio sp.]MDD3313529.1 RIP metalloprotease RseP [Pseudodesulfovibrio sp.]
MLTSTIAIVLVLGGLIFFHELGHFSVARVFGMGVKTFSLGFGPKLFGFVSGRTEYKLSAIPLGGYVSLAGEAGEEDEGFPDNQLFSMRPAWQRMCVVAAGPIFNFLLAFLIYWFLALAQGEGILLPVAGGVMPDSPAAAAGFKTGDRVLSIDGQPIESWTDMVMTIRGAGGRELAMRVDRQGETLTLRVTPHVKTFKNLYGEEETVPVVGVLQGNVVAYRPVEGSTFVLAMETTWFQCRAVLKGFVAIIERLIPAKSIGGPIMIAQLIHQGAQSGVYAVLALAAVISINLAILNLLPIPVLDGGHILFNALEIIFRRPLNDKWKAMAMRIGLLFLLSLMALAIFNDFSRLLS